MNDILYEISRLRSHIADLERTLKDCRKALAKEEKKLSDPWSREKQLLKNMCSEKSASGESVARYVNHLETRIKEQDDHLTMVTAMNKTSHESMAKYVSLLEAKIEELENKLATHLQNKGSVVHNSNKNEIRSAKAEDRLLSWPDGIKAASQLFELKTSGDSFSGLLHPDSQSPIFSYGRPAVLVHGSIKENLKTPLLWGPQKGYLLRASINSIDDDSIVFVYPTRETITEARKDMEKFIDWVNCLKYRCPWLEEIEEFCSQNGCRFEQ